MSDVRIEITGEDLEAMIERSVSRALSNVGLRAEDPERADAVRDDLAFLRKLRLALEGAASKVGTAVIITVVGGVMSLMALGVGSWIGQIDTARKAAGK